jgi:hypothetical protein
MNDFGYIVTGHDMNDDGNWGFGEALEEIDAGTGTAAAAAAALPDGGELPMFLMPSSSLRNDEFRSDGIG